MTSSSSPPPDLASLTLGPQRVQNDPFDEYDHRSPFHFSTSPSVLPQHTAYNPFAPQHSPAKAKTPIRASLPSQWLDSPGPPLPDTRPLSPQLATNSDLSSGGGSPPLNHVQQLPLQSLDDEIIPTAIVIKNIPFNVKRETLLDIIASLSIPTPYAFNYHLDPAGAFRGLAFANFRAASDADAVVAALNGFDVQGRKLRVEYKKVLQAGEKERIEREKALRRMRSMQLEKEQQAAVHARYDDFAPSPAFTPGRPYSLDPPMPVPAPAYGLPPPQPQPAFLPPVPAPHFAPQQGSPPTKASATELDLNDPSTLEIYSRILLFKDDRMRDELAFARSLAPRERRVVHLIAQKLGLFHYSVGDGPDRYAVVTRVDPAGRSAPARPAQHTLRRAPSTYILGASAPAIPEGNDLVPGLRGKKSMPDLKSLHSAAAGPRLGTRTSNNNLREGFATIAGGAARRAAFGALFGAAAVPPLPEQPPAMPVQDAGVVRQPRGPGATAGFGARRESRVAMSESAAGGPTSAPAPGAERASRASVGLEARSHEPLEI